MLRNVIEDYLSSIKELQLFQPFQLLLETKEFYDIHYIHSPTEFGKDFIAKKRIDGIEVQFAFQLKVGNINLNKFRNEVQSQLLEACTNKLSHPNFDTSIEYRVIFVTSGNLLQPASIAFQEFNKFVTAKFNIPPILTWEKEKLINDFITIGIEPFFSIHKSPEIIGKFFNFYAQIKNNKPIDYLAIEDYSEYWLDIDWQIKENRLQIFFETYFFSKLLYEQGNYYEAVLILGALVRVLLKNNEYNNYQTTIQKYLKEIIEKYSEKVKNVRESGESLLSECKSTFSIFYYPILCLKTQELLAIDILVNNNEELKELFLEVLDNENGCFHPIGDNYAISIVFIALTLLKINEIKRLKKFLNNVTVWLCDRYEKDGIGLGFIGANLREEIEQLLSEHLSGYIFNYRKTSFIAACVLDIAYLIGDKELYENIANDLRASNIILEFFHVLNNNSLYKHNHIEIIKSSDHDFSSDFCENYSQPIQYERENNSISLRTNGLFFIMILLRDRYFPTFIKELV